jgi:2-iminobutanoate/2-iminopropanoate deaminase
MSGRKKVITSLRAPKAIGPYSQAIKAKGFLFCSGQIAIDPGSGGMTAGGVKHQTRQILENINRLLVDAGSGMDKVVKTTVFLTSMDTFDEMNSVYSEFFPTNPPARSTVEVGRLPKNVLVEIECIALA